KGFALAGGALMLMFLFGPDRFSPASVHGDDSALGRILAWQAGLKMLAGHPIFGVGHDQFEKYHEITAHNSFVLAMAEGGLVQLVAWVGLKYWAVLTLVRVRRVERERRLSGGEV